MTPNAFDLNEDQRTTLNLADQFARHELAPLAARMDDEEWWPPDMFPKLGEAGYLGMTAPPELNGTGLDLFSSGLVMQAFARWNPAVAMSHMGHENLCLHNLLRNANDEQRRRLIPGMVDGSRVGALGMTEPGAGSDAIGGMQTTARRDGDHYVINGRKLYITNGSIADVILVYTKTKPEAGAHGISAFAFDTNTPGFTVAQKLAKMGFRGCPTTELVFEDCRVPVADRIGEENAGVGVMMSGLDIERAIGAVLCIGIAERCLDLAVEYARERKQFGKPIGAFQMIQSKLADMYTDIEAARCLAYKGLAAASALAVGDGGRGDVHKLTAASILLAAETASRVASDAVQIHGGGGYIWEMEVNRLYRSTKLMEIGAGTSEIRRLIIAGELLGPLR